MKNFMKKAAFLIIASSLFYGSSQAIFGSGYKPVNNSEKKDIFALIDAGDTEGIKNIENAKKLMSKKNKQGYTPVQVAASKLEEIIDRSRSMQGYQQGDDLKSKAYIEMINYFIQQLGAKTSELKKYPNALAAAKAQQK